MNARLNGFDYERSEAWRAIKAKLGAEVSHGELKSVAQLLCEETGLRLDRDASRDNRVLIKWFQDNWPRIEHLMQQMHLCDENERRIFDTTESPT